MIPLRDHEQTETTPVITWLILGINVVVFVFMLSMGRLGLQEFIEQFALVPLEIVSGESWHSLITSMFLHGGIGHILGNMMFLHVFGDNLEDWLGHIGFIGFYLMCGLAASLLQIAVDPTSSIPNLGASGAIAGLLGAYLMKFPSHRVDVLIPLGYVLRQVTLPAYTMLLYWFVIQFFSGVGSLTIPQQGGVAYFAHIGGFVAGVGLAMGFRGWRSLRD